MNEIYPVPEQFVKTARTNEQEYLSEIFAGGALTKVKSAGVLTPKASD